MPTYGINIRVIISADNPRQAAEHFAREVHMPVEKNSEHCVINKIEPPEELRSFIYHSIVNVK